MGYAGARRQIRDGLCRNRLTPITHKKASLKFSRLHVSANLTCAKIQKYHRETRVFRWNNEAMMESALLVFAGLMGAAGIVLAAASAHGTPGSGLDSAGTMLLFHAASVIGGVSLLHQTMLSRTVGIIALCGFVLGSALFAGDVAARATIGSRLFPMAAPTGGVILIASWLVLALSALTAR